MDSQLTGRVKHYAFTMGADLVGVANIERFANAPRMMSPQGIMPQARSVVVCALHHPDGCIEMGGRKHPQDVGPYGVQGTMNTHLDHMSYEMSRFLEDEGYESIPIAASNIWRYRSYKELSAIFAPDMSHIYAAVAAGLTELGYHGISMSPEFGPRNRFVSIITTAPLDPTPLLPGNTLCDHCNQCVKHCLAGALSEEIPGTEDLVIEDRRYTKAIKNLWRCSWGEHFGVDLDLPKPEVVTEENIIETVRQHGMRGGEMGSCLRHCLPPEIRRWDSEYTNAPRRQPPFVPTGETLPRWVQEKMTAAALAAGVDQVMVHDQAGLADTGLNFAERLPDATRALTMAVYCPGGQNLAELGSAALYTAQLAALLASRKLEDLGYSVVVSVDLGQEVMRPVVTGIPEGWQVFTATVLTSAPLTLTPPTQAAVTRPRPRCLTTFLKQKTLALGCDAVGVASVERLADLKRQLAPVFDGETLLVAENRGERWLEFRADVHEETRTVRDAGDHLPGAQSVLVIGLRVPAATVSRVGEPPAEVVGPYVFAQYVVQWSLRKRALHLVRLLQELGYRAEVTLDLMNTGSLSANPRGPQANAFGNRFAAVAAGLGTLGRGGFVLSPQWGANMRFAAIVTDAPLKADALPDLQALAAACEGCDLCLGNCPVSAYADEVSVTLEGQTLRFQRLDQKRCDWSLRYALVGSDGFAKLGSRTHIMPPEEITAEVLTEALSQFDTVQGHHRCGVESCLVRCPLALGEVKA